MYYYVHYFSLYMSKPVGLISIAVSVYYSVSLSVSLLLFFFPQRCLPVVPGQADPRLALCQLGVCQRYAPLHPLSQALGSGIFMHPL